MEKYSKIRISTLLSPETLAKVKNEAHEKCISESAVIRQKVEASYREIDLYGVSHLKQYLKPLINKTDPEFGTGNN